MAIDTDIPTDPPLLRVSGPDELAQAIPYLLGFHPTRSLVMVGLRAGRVVVTARLDLDDAAGTDGAGVLGETLAAMLDARVVTLVAVVYDADAHVHGTTVVELPWCPVADRVHLVADLVGVEVAEVVLVSGSRLWSYECDDPVCCPPEGRRLEADSRVAASAAYAGLVALPDRASLAALLARRIDPAVATRLGDTLHSAEAAEPAASERSQVRALFAAARRLDEPQARTTLTDTERSRFALALRRIPVRDSIWIGIDERRIDGRALWQALATSLPAPYDAAPLFLFGWASYRAGDGALARIAAERSLESDPGYSPADIVLAALDRALDPRRLPRVRRRTDRPTAARPGGAPGSAGRTRR